MNLRNISFGVDFWAGKIKLEIYACVKLYIGKISCGAKKFDQLKEYDLAVIKSLYGSRKPLKCKLYKAREGDSYVCKIQYH